MPSLDIFRRDAFSLQQMSASINNLPRVPSRLAELGLFESGGVASTRIWIEEKNGDLELIQTSLRGAPAKLYLPDRRKAREFSIPHITLESTIYADSIQDVRAFGSETELETVESAVNDHMRPMQQRIEATIEHMKVGALKGEILDADGSTIHDLFDTFGVSQIEQDFAFSSSSTKVRNVCVSVARQIEDVLGMTPHTGLRGFCGRDFFDALISHPDVERAYERYEAGAALRDDVRGGFQFGRITFEEYSGSVAGEPYIAADACYVVPEGTDLFQIKYAPADFFDAANTVGLPLYARNELDDQMQRWVRIHTQSNPLPLNLRPRCVVKCVAK